MDTLYADQIVENREVIDYLLSQLNTSCPGIVKSFDPATQTVTVQPTIQMKVVRGTDTFFIDPTDIYLCPCVIPVAAVKGFALTLPISAGDPCLIHFTQRCFDNWYENGCVQPPEDSSATIRHHHYSDAIVTFAPLPLTQVFTNWLTNGIELRNRARNSRVTVLDDKVEIQVASTSIVVENDGTVTISASTEVTVNTPLTHITGDVEIDGGVICNGTYGISGGDIRSARNVYDSIRSMAGDRGIYNGHTHGDPQGGNTAGPGSLE